MGIAFLLICSLLVFIVGFFEDCKINFVTKNQRYHIFKNHRQVFFLKKQDKKRKLFHCMSVLKK